MAISTAIDKIFLKEKFIFIGLFGVLAYFMMIRVFDLRF